MRHVYALFCLSLCFMAVSPAHGQTQKRATSSAVKPGMTNADVVKMVRAGVAADTVVLAIQNGKTRFDTSPDALISLNQNGVPKAIVDAMLTSASHKPGDPVVAAQNLNDEFAKAALRALKAIDGELGTLSMNNGQAAAPRATQQFIEDSDANARTDDEKAIVATLHNLFILKLFTNMEREVIMLEGYEPISEARAKAKADADPSILDKSSRLAGCSGALDAILRSRNYKIAPSECSNLSIDAPKKAMN